MNNPVVNVNRGAMVFLLIALFAFLGIVFCLKYNFLLPWAYIICLLCLFFCLVAIIKYNQLTKIIPFFLLIYSSAIVSIFAIRFGLFHGDSQIELIAVLDIVKNHHVLFGNTYLFSNYPMIDLFSSIFGTILGKNIYTIYDIVIWVPSIIGILCAMFIFITVKKFSNDFVGFFASIMWISLPFVSRWLIQFTRTTIAILFLLILSFLLITRYKQQVEHSWYGIFLIFSIALIFSHPVVSFFFFLSIIFTLGFQKIIPYLNNSKISENVGIEFSNDTQISIQLILIVSILLVLNWIYVGYTLDPFVEVVNVYSDDIEPLARSIFGLVVMDKAQSSYSVASLEMKLFGLLRVSLFFLISIFGLIILLKKRNINNKKFSNTGIIESFVIFGLIFMIGNLILGIASTSSYRTIVYSSAWLILAAGIFLHYSLCNLEGKKITVLAAISLIFLIIPAPFFTGEVVLPSDWIYNSNPSDMIDYDHGENQRFLEYYHFTLPIWIKEYTNTDDLIWSDGTHSQSAIIGYGQRNAIYSSKPITAEGLDIESLEKLNVNYVYINSLMRKSLLIPYGLPSSYPKYNFGPLEDDKRSIKIYDSNDANLYRIS